LIKIAESYEDYQKKLDHPSFKIFVHSWASRYEVSC